MEDKRVSIPIIYESKIDDEKVKQVCAGLEEEGVPYILREKGTYHEGNHLFSLPVSIVITNEQLMIHHEKLPKDKSYISGKIGDERLIGKNAARLVKGLPLVLDK